METVQQVLAELKKKGDAQTRKTFARHGAPEGFFGVKIGELKLIARKIKGRQDLACALYDSGNPDAMYLAGIVADGKAMTKQQLQAWADGASWHMLSQYTVPWVAAESPHARELALKWMKSKKESVASSGWCTYSGIVATRPDEELDLKEIEGLLEQVAREVHTAPNDVRSTMNAFVISVGGYVKPLLAKAKRIAKRMGKVDVDVGDTSCKVPDALEYIEKIEKMGRVGKKRKTFKC